MPSAHLLAIVPFIDAVNGRRSVPLFSCTKSVKTCTEYCFIRGTIYDAQPDSLSVLDVCLNQFLTSTEPATSEQNSVEMEIDRFISISPVDRSKYPTACDWWRQNHHLYPNVARVAKRYLPAPPTSVASECLFCSSSCVFTDRHNRLAPKKADVLLFIKHNLPLISFKY